MATYTHKFSELDSSKVKEVGGKNSSLGEMFQQLGEEGIRIPDGFATTAEAYWKFLEENDLNSFIEEKLGELDRDEFSNLKDIGQTIRQKIMESPLPEELVKDFKKAYEELKEREEDLESVAVRSSATAEDLPEASFAGQHESFMNIKEPDDVVETIKKCGSI